MKISKKDWNNYITRLRKINSIAADKVTKYMGTVDIGTDEGMKSLLDYSYAVSTAYGEAATELACQMYDAVALVSKVNVPPAEPAATATYGEVVRAVKGKMFDTKEPAAVGSAVGRLVKMAGVDTTMQNALRDGAEWAWIPSGDTCAFCLTLASRGWQKASKKAIRGGHAEHIHHNCDCTYAIRFDGKSDVDGYDPDALYDEYINAGDTPQERINALRRQQYAANPEKYRAQKRAAYARHTGTAERIENTTKNDIMNMKVNNRGEVLNPMNPEEYFKIKKALEKQGVEVVSATEGDDLRYMLSLGAEATYSNSRITHIGEIPSRGTLMEEIIHMRQSRKYGELDSSDFVELYAREIEANRKLLKYKDAYKIHSSDIKDIEKNLDAWERKFQKAVGTTYDDSNYRRKN